MRQVDEPSGLSVTQPFKFPSLKGEAMQFVDVNSRMTTHSRMKVVCSDTKEGVLLEVDGPIKQRFGNAQGLDGVHGSKRAQAVQSFAGARGGKQQHRFSPF